MEGEETVTLEVPTEEVATEVQQQTLETSEIALGVASNAAEVAATASDDAAELTEEIEELEISWQETAAQLGTAVAGLQSTAISQTQVLQSLAESQSQMRAEIAARDILTTELLTRLALGLEALAPKDSPQSEGEGVPREAEVSPAEASPEPPKETPRRRRIL